MTAPDTLVRLENYVQPTFAIPSVSLTFELAELMTRVRASLQVRRTSKDSSLPLRLNGRGLSLLEIKLDGRPLEAWEYQATSDELVVMATPDAFVLETYVQIAPHDNLSGLGLFVANGALITQCETEGFRRLTYFLDRPDVLSLFDVMLIADEERYPVLLSNGHPMGQGCDGAGRSWARWADPVPKPCYLFALVAGVFSKRERTYLAPSGRTIQLGLYADPRHTQRCEFALDALEASMRWEEANWGAEYDLDVYNIVAADGFNAAEENKGLNIFAANELVADPSRTTDDEYVSIEITVAHEYFHNLTGNRITVRDWFQKALKEGLTRFRDRTFSSDQGASDMRRLDFVSLINREQFREDDSSAAHAVQPTWYVETPDFVTMTIYDKGAELFRMLRTLAGAEGFRRATDLYVARRDGTAAKLEDFLEDYADATGRDVTLFRRWFDQIGRPRLKVSRHYDAEARRLDLKISQSTPASAAQPNPGPQHIPIVAMVRDNEGLTLPGHAEVLLELTQPTQTFSFFDVPPGAIPSILRGFSAPVTVIPFLEGKELATLAIHDDDAFVRWHSMQRLGVLALREGMAGHDGEATLLYTEAWHVILGDASHPGVKAHLLQVPNEPLLSEDLPTIDLEAGMAARLAAIARLVSKHLDALLAVRQTGSSIPYRPAPDDIAARRLKNLVLLLLCQAGKRQGIEEALLQFRSANNLTDQVAAFTALVEVDEQREAIVGEAEAMWTGNDAAMAHWWRVQAARQAPDTALIIKDLMRRPDFDIENPALTRPLTFAFFRANRSGFHARSGAGYDLLEAIVRDRDARMPERVHWLMPQILEWRRYDRRRQALMKATLRRLSEGPNASQTLRSLCTVSLAEPTDI